MPSISHLLPTLFRALCATAGISFFMPQDLPAQDAETPAQAPKLVFAHYMVAVPRTGGHATVEEYKSEIRDAQALGIDGFALNSGGWTVEQKVPSYKVRTERIYQAAKELNSGFKLFISADFATELNFGEFVDMVETFRSHPNQLYHDGKPVISTFRDEKQNLTQLSDSAFTGERAIMLVPFYFPNPTSETPDAKLTAQVLAANPSLPGFFLFGAAGTPGQLAESVTQTARVWHDAGKLFMAPVTPYYRGRGGNFRAFESHGFQGMALGWETAIKTGAQWVEVVTWNDWNESSYVCPLDARSNTILRPAGGTNPETKLLPHEAWLEASRHYIEWFKTGVEPTVKEDAFYYFYRLHPKTVPARDGRFPLHVEKLEDAVHATVFVRENATFSITCGEESRSFELSAGVHHVKIPMASGTPRFTLSRGGVIVLEKQGEESIGEDKIWAGYNYFSGSSRPAPAAP